MSKTATIIALHFALAGCASYATQEDLTRTASELRSETSATANASSLAVYECVLNRDLASQAYSHCAMIEQRFGAEVARQQPACAIASAWTEHCAVTNDEEVLQNPRPGVDQAITAIITAAQAVRDAQTSGDTAPTSDASTEPTTTPGAPPHVTCETNDDSCGSEFVLGSR